MPDEAFNDRQDYVGKEFQSRRDGAITIKVREVGTTEFWVEDNDGYRYSLEIADFDRYWKRPFPKVGELWTRKYPYQGRCEVLAVADNYVVFTFDPTGSRANPVSARTLDNFMRTYEPPEK